MFRLSSTVTNLSYIHKISSVWAGPVKVVLGRTRICCSVVLHCSVVAPGPNKLSDTAVFIPQNCLHSFHTLERVSPGWEQEEELHTSQQGSWAFKWGPAQDICGSATFVGICHWDGLQSLRLILCFVVVVFPVLGNDRCIKHKCKVNINNSPWS